MYNTQLTQPCFVYVTTCFDASGSDSDSCPAIEKGGQQNLPSCEENRDKHAWQDWLLARQVVDRQNWLAQSPLRQQESGEAVWQTDIRKKRLDIPLSFVWQNHRHALGLQAGEFPECNRIQDISSWYPTVLYTVLCTVYIMFSACLETLSKYHRATKWSE